MKKILILLTLFLTLSAGVCASENILFTEVDEYNNLKLGNDYIVIVVNMDENAQGRFAIETTGGAPLRSNDDYKPLVYGRPKPWTSYTTIWLNGDYYVFGGQTGRRAGKSGKYGQVIEAPHVENDSIVTVTKFNEALLVEQFLTPVKSSTTGLFDTVQIKYRLKNISSQEQKVGLRIMLDTMLGQNDGAPFRIGEDAVTGDRVYYLKQLPAFYQAFDSISNPQVTSQGTFIGAGVTPPDRVNLADWGSLADGVWDFDFNPGEEFLRKGEYEIDSAIAMYWVPEILAPGQEKTYITNYGLGGITIVPGLLSLGVTSPAEVTLNQPEKTFPIIAYIENTSEISAKKVKVNLELPAPLMAEEKLSKELGDLPPQGIAQIIWNVQVKENNLPAQVNYKVRVEADNTDANEVTREIKFVGPPRLETSLQLGEKLTVIEGKLQPNPFKIKANIRNGGGSTLFDVAAELILPPGLVMAPKEKSKKYLGDLQAGEAIELNWQVKALNVAGQLPFALEVKALHDYQDTKVEELNLPELAPYLYFQLQQKAAAIQSGDYINVDIKCQNLSNIDKILLNLEFDPQVLKPIFVSRGNIFLKGSALLPWKEPIVSEDKILIEAFLPDNVTEGTIATLHFKVLEEEGFDLIWENNLFFDENGQPMDVKSVDLQIKREE